jgi:hypothetical protein
LHLKRLENAAESMVLESKDNQAESIDGNLEKMNNEIKKKCQIEAVKKDLEEMVKKAAHIPGVLRFVEAVCEKTKVLRISSSFLSYDLISSASASSPSPPSRSLSSSPTFSPSLPSLHIFSPSPPILNSNSLPIPLITRSFHLATFSSSPILTSPSPFSYYSPFSFSLSNSPIPSYSVSSSNFSFYSSSLFPIPC